MKKIVSLILSTIMVMSIGTTAFAAEMPSEDTTKPIQQEMVQEEENLIQAADTKGVELVYRHQVNQIMSSNYYNAFSVPKKGLLPFKRKVYLSGGAKFADGVARNITVTVGNKKFTVLADGTAKLRGSLDVSTEMPVMISIEGINSKCAVVFDVYTLD